MSAHMLIGYFRSGPPEELRKCRTKPKNWDEDHY